MTRTTLKPHCVLRVGVVGNRRFGGEKDAGATTAADAIRARATIAMTELWRVLFNSVAPVLARQLTGPGAHGVTYVRDLFENVPPRVTVFSSLAAGSDQIGAHTALSSADAAVSVDIVAVLPFGEGDYPGLPGAEREEFRHEEAETLRTLTGMASQVIRLDGKYDDVHRQDGYRRARDMLLENSDLLVAIYDPFTVGRSAGAVETVGLALDTGTPVITVLVREEGARIAVRREPAHAPRTASTEWDAAFALGDEPWKRQIEACVAEQLLPPEALAADAGHPEDLERAIYRLKLISGEAQLPTMCRWEKTFAATWRSLLRLAKATHASAEPPSAAITLEPYASLYHRTSELAGMYIATYRGAFVLSYLLASLAVAAAVAMLATSLLAHGHPSLWIVVPLCVAKLSILGVLIRLELAGHAGRFQEAGADFRYLAELLRPMQWLARTGTYPPAVDLPVHASQHDPRRSWTAWRARAVARSSPCVADISSTGGSDASEVSMNATAAASALDRAANEWLEGQVLYHAANTQRMRTLDHALERWSKRLLWTVLTGAAVACALEIALHSQLVPGVAEKYAVATAVILGAFAAVLPALIAALAGIAFQSEAKRLAMRSQAMAENLRAQQHRLNRTATAMRSVAEPGASSTARKMLRQVSASTIEEAGDWKVLYEVHEIHAG